MIYNHCGLQQQWHDENLKPNFCISGGANQVATGAKEIDVENFCTVSSQFFVCKRGEKAA